MSKKINMLKEDDIYSMSMFLIYKLIDIPEYSINGELPYILDKNSLLNFCNYFGGRTIRVPTIKEIYSTMCLVLLYQYTKIDGIDYDEAFRLIGFKNSEIKTVRTAYNKLCEVLDKYEFSKKPVE